MTTKRKGIPCRKWTQEEIDFVARVYEDMDYTVEEIAKEINRTRISVIKKAASLGLTRANPYVNRVTQEGHRICCTCKQELPLEQFTKARNKRYGVESSCKACVKLKKIQKKEKQKQEEILKTKPTKVCRECNVEYPHTEEYFYWNSSRLNYKHICKKCSVEQVKKMTEENYRTKGYKK